MEPIDLAVNLEAFNVASTENSKTATILFRSCCDLVSVASNRSCNSQSKDAPLKNEAAEEALMAWLRTGMPSLVTALTFCPQGGGLPQGGLLGRRERTDPLFGRSTVGI